MMKSSETRALDRRVDEFAKRAAARATREVLVRRGGHLGMYTGCGFPKSGTVWLCQLMGTALGVPYPREYRSPIAMAAIVHGHWRYDRRYPRPIYIRRDGRDVMVSMYFYYVRALGIRQKPVRALKLRAMFERLYGPNFDPQAVRANLPKFIEAQFASPRGSGGLAWHEHVADWLGRKYVAQVSYEALLASPVSEVARLMEELGGVPDQRIAELAAERWDFARMAGRSPGEENREGFVRKGVAGDWRNYFSRETGEVFDALAGEALVELGYETDRHWYEAL